MPTILRNILAAILGAVIGGAVNMGIVMLSPHLIPPPAGVDVTTAGGLQKSIHLFQPQHFLMPFLAHALGTFVGAFVASSIAVGSAKLRISLVIGVLFLAGGIMAVRMIPAPVWFDVTDLVFAYIPMALLGWKLSGNLFPQN